MANTLNPRQRQLHSRALQVSSDCRRSQAKLIGVLIELDQTKLYKQLDCSSLFVYAVKYLKLDESEAYASITVARKAREVPRLMHALREQKMTVNCG